MYGNTSKEKMQVFRVPENVRNMTENANKSEKPHKIRRFENETFFTFLKKIKKSPSFCCGRILQKKVAFCDTCKNGACNYQQSFPKKIMQIKQNDLGAKAND